jgi:hypothetical protein
MRAATACLIAIAALGLALPGADARKPKLSSCQKLAKRYKDRSPDRKLVLVVRGDDETGDISACVLPRGKIRKVTDWDDGLARDSGRIVATARAWVLYEDFHSDQYGGTSRALTRFDVRNGRRLALTSFGCMLDYSTQQCPDGTNYGHVVLAATGAGAVEVTDYAAHTTTLRAFSPAGALTKIADGAVDTLHVTAGEIAWTQGGAAFTAPLPA